MKPHNPTGQKILLLLLTGVALGLTRSPRQYFRIIKNTTKTWKTINREQLYNYVREFHKSRLISYREEKNGTINIVLTEKGRKKALRYKLEELEIKTPLRWDQKWRLVIFDIPEKHKKAREALRYEIKKLGMEELQKSVFVYPFECENEINFIVEVFDIRPYVRYITATKITNEEELRIRFELV